MESERLWAASPIVGIRAWGIVGPRGARRLSPVSDPAHTVFSPRTWRARDDNPWDTRGWARAECPLRLRPGTYHEKLRAYPTRHALEAPWCRCGIWAQKAFEGTTVEFVASLDKRRLSQPWYTLNKIGPPQPKFAFGEVSLKGAVIEHEYGYRGEMAKPRLLISLGRHEELLNDLGLWYSIPVVPFRDWSEGGGVMWLS